MTNDSNTMVSRDLFTFSAGGFVGGIVIEMGCVGCWTPLLDASSCLLSSGHGKQNIYIQNIKDAHSSSSMACNWFTSQLDLFMFHRGIIINVFTNSMREAEVLLVSVVNSSL